MTDSKPTLPRRPLKQRLAAGEAVIGSWLSFGYTPLAEMMAKAGFDWLVIDCEHGVTTSMEMLQLIQIIDLAGCTPIVRVGANDPLLIKHAMDAGAKGVVVPMVCSAAEAKAAVDAVYYPPVGRRGVGLARAQDFGMGFDRYCREAAEEHLVIVQIEHIDAVERLDSILAVSGVDGFIVGPYDLSGSLGVPGNFGHPAVVAAMDRLMTAIATHPKPGGFHVVHSDPVMLRQRLEQGSRLLAYGTEMIFLAERLAGLRGELDTIRSTLDTTRVRGTSA